MIYVSSTSGRTNWIVSDGCLTERGEFGSLNRSAQDTLILLNLLKDQEWEIRAAAKMEEEKIAKGLTV